MVTVNATIFTQVVDAKQALFSVENFDVAIDALARTALRSVIGTMTLDEALSERERINTDVQQQMEVVTDKWGIRISRIEIVEIAPPPQILAGAGPAEAGRPGEAGQDPAVRGPAAVGHQRRRGRRAGRRARRPRASGRPPSCGPRATGRRPSSRPRAAPRRSTTVYGAIKKADPDPTLVAILQLDALGQVRRQRQRQDRRARSRAPACSAPPRRCAACSPPPRERRSSSLSVHPGDREWNQELAAFSTACHWMCRVLGRVR